MPQLLLRKEVVPKKQGIACFLAQRRVAQLYFILPWDTDANYSTMRLLVSSLRRPQPLRFVLFQVTSNLPSSGIC